MVGFPPDRARARRILLAVIALLAAFYGGYELGRTSAGYAIIHAAFERLEGHRQVERLVAENAGLQRRVDAATVEQQVDTRLQSEAQRMIGELEAETARQQQELEFYRGLVSRQFGAGTLRVQDLKIRHQQDRRYRVEITLVQAGTRDATASGVLSLAVSGERGGALIQLPMSELGGAHRRELPFSLRYFQQLELPIELPEGFMPASLLVEYRQGRNLEPVRQSFTWRVEDEPPVPAL